MSVRRLDTLPSLALYLRSWLKDGYSPVYAAECAKVACRERGNTNTQEAVDLLLAKLSSPHITSLRSSEHAIYEFIQALETPVAAKGA